MMNEEGRMQKEEGGMMNEEGRMMNRWGCIAPCFAVLLPIPKRSPLAPLAGRGAGGEGSCDRFLELLIHATVNTG